MPTQTMRIVIDHQPTDLTAHTAQQAVTAAAAWAQANGRLITDVVIDGQPVDPVKIRESTATAGAACGCEVCVTTAEPAELVGQVLRDAAAALEEADALQQSAAQDIQADRLPQAMESLSAALTIWTSVQQSLAMGSQVPGLDLISELASDHHQEALAQLNAHLRAIRQALQDRDPVSLSDTLMYDLPDVVVQWRSLLHELHQRVTAGV